MLKFLLIAFSLFLLAGCTTKEVTVLETECAKPTLDMSKYSEPKTVHPEVYKGAMSVTIKNSDYSMMKETNQDIKDRYVKLRAWVLTNIENGLIKVGISDE